MTVHLKLYDQAGSLRAVPATSCTPPTCTGASTVRVLQVPLELAETDLRELLASVLAELQPSIRSKDLRVEVMVTTGAPCKPMQVDPSSMRQVFKNVLANAVRFSPAQGRIEIRFAAAELPPESSASLPRPALEIAVRDEGVGIPAEELESIFDMFVQSRKARTNAAGTGLGLPICRQITDRHCGTIRARNNPDAGATFSITLPLQAAFRNHAA